MKELDFSEEACIERYVAFPFFEEEAEDIIADEDAETDDPVIRMLHLYGSVAVDSTATQERPQARRIPMTLRKAA